MEAKRGIFNPMVITVIAILFGILSYLISPHFLERLELDTIDLRFNIRGKVPTTGDIVLAVVDEKSINKEGKWVWPREKFARLITKLSDEGAKVIAFDIGFLETDKVDLKIIETIDQIRNRLQESGTSTTEDFTEYLTALKKAANQDQLLAEAIRRSEAKVVLGYFFHTFLAKEEIPEKKDIEAHRKNIEGSEYKIKKMTSDAQYGRIIQGVLPQSNISVISEASEFSGHFNIEPDRDGVVRKIPLALRFDGGLYAPLSLISASAFLGKPLSIDLDNLGVRAVRIGRTSLPVTPDGKMLINYRGGEKTFEHYSITDILNDDSHSGKYKDKIVMVGVTAIGIYDMRVMPFDNIFPGLEIHANVADSLLAGQFMEKPDWVSLSDLVMIILFAVVLGLLLPRFGVMSGTLVVIALFSGYVWASQYLFSRHGLIISMIYPLSVMMVMYVGITVYRFFSEARQKKFIREAFSHYLAPSVVKQMIESPENLVLGGENRYITAFFSDLQGFTSISEKLEPEQLVELLNEFLTEMTDIILKYEGTVDKFEGDAIIAFFGAPNIIENHPKVACMASIEMQKRLSELRKVWESRNMPPLKMRIGMCTGQAVVGNMGSKNRMDYTMIGDTVNTAARLEGINKFYSTSILVNENTAKEAGSAIVTREVDLISAVGKQQAVKIYEVLGFPNDVDENRRKAVSLYSEGMEAYRNMEWDRAVSLFSESLTMVPDDGPSQTMLERVKAFRMQPPPANWGGVFTAKTK